MFEKSKWIEAEISEFLSFKFFIFFSIQKKWKNLFVILVVIITVDSVTITGDGMAIAVDLDCKFCKV